MHVTITQIVFGTEGAIAVNINGSCANDESLFNSSYDTSSQIAVFASNLRMKPKMQFDGRRLIGMTYHRMIPLDESNKRCCPFLVAFLSSNKRLIQLSTGFNFAPYLTLQTVQPGDKRYARQPDKTVLKFSQILGKVKMEKLVPHTARCIGF